MTVPKSPLRSPLRSVANPVFRGVAPPVNTVLPVISGSAIQGQTLSATNGTWLNTPTSYTYQWKDDDVAIPGATASTHRLSSVQIGGVITVTVTAINAGGSVAATSDGTVPVEATVPLDGLSPTGAWSMSRDLTTAFIGSSRYTNVSGAVSSLNGQISARHLTQGTAGSRPLVASAGPNSRACADFDGTDDSLVGAAASTFLAVGAKFIVISAIIDAVSLNASAQANHYVIGGDGNHWGITARALNGVTFYSYNWDSVNYDAAAETGVVDTPYVLTLRHDGGNLYISKNGGAEVVAASGSTSTLTDALRIGARSTTAQRCNMKLFEAATFSTVPDEATRNTLIADMMDWVGAA